MSVCRQGTPSPVSAPGTPPERDEAEELRGLFEDLGWMNRGEGGFEAFIGASAEDLQSMARMSMEREELAQAIKEAVRTTRTPHEPENTAATTIHLAVADSLARHTQPDIVVESEGEEEGEQEPAAIAESARRCRPSFIEGHDLDLIPFLLLPSTADNRLRLSIEAEQKRAAVLHSSVQKQTATAYGRSVRSYIEFCEKERIPPAERFPAQSKVVEAFLASFVGIRRAATVSAYYGGLKFWHAIHSLGPPLQDGMWRRVMRGLVAQQPPAKNLRPPATYRDLIVIREALDLEEPEDACLWAAATCAFFAMARPGDVTLENRRATILDPKKHFTGVSCKIIDESADFPACIELSLPFDKAEGYKGETLIIVGQKIDPRICPLEAMRNHRRVNNPGPQDFLFASRPRNPSGWGEGLYPLTGDWFRNRINSILTSANRSPLNGHSWRIGGATFYLLAGVHPDFIRVIGRWKSDAFYRYWRKIKAIAAKYLTDAALVDAEDHMPDPERV
ncbi:hypothetical protein JCM8115_004333 [Rhodotorula mucilaginosa]